MNKQHEAPIHPIPNTPTDAAGLAAQIAERLHDDIVQGERAASTLFSHAAEPSHALIESVASCISIAAQTVRAATRARIAAAILRDTQMLQCAAAAPANAAPMPGPLRAALYQGLSEQRQMLLQDRLGVRSTSALADAVNAEARAASAKFLRDYTPLFDRLEHAVRNA